MIEKIKNNSVSDIFNEVSRHRSGTPANSTSQEADASLQLSYSALIEEAKQAQIQDQTAVQRARELIDTGQLDNIENLRAAAEAILEFGI